MRASRGDGTQRTIVAAKGGDLLARHGHDPGFPASEVVGRKLPPFGDPIGDEMERGPRVSSRIRGPAAIGFTRRVE
jgi:hypothetical protein